MEDYDVRSAASILASVKEQEARFEQLTRALEEERRNVNLQLEHANLPPNPPASQPLAWQQVVMQVNDRSQLLPCHVPTTEVWYHAFAPTFLKRRDHAPSFQHLLSVPTVLNAVQDSALW